MGAVLHDHTERVENGGTDPEGIAVKQSKRKLPPQRLVALLETHAGEGLSDLPSDCCVVFQSNPETDAWMDAIACFDRFNDIEPLIRLFLDGPHVTADARICIEDLMERRRSKKIGKRHRPIYDPPDKVKRLLQAEREWREIQETQEYLRKRAGESKGVIKDGERRACDSKVAQSLLNVTQRDIEYKYALAEDKLTDFFQRQIKHARHFQKRLGSWHTRPVLS